MLLVIAYVDGGLLWDFSRTLTIHRHTETYIHRHTYTHACMCIVYVLKGNLVIPQGVVPTLTIHILVYPAQPVGSSAMSIQC